MFGHSQLRRDLIRCQLCFLPGGFHLAEYRTTSLMAFSHSPVHCGNSSEHHTDQPKSDHTVMGDWHGKPMVSTRTVEGC